MCRTMARYQRTRSKPRYYKKADHSYSGSSYALESQDVDGYCPGDSQQYNSDSSSDDTTGREIMDRQYERRGEQFQKEVDKEAERVNREDDEEFDGYNFNQGNHEENQDLPFSREGGD